MHMKNRHSKQVVSAALLACTLLFAAEGCKKPKPTPPPAPAPTPAATPAAKPSISRFDAEPSSVEKGQPSTLSWSVSGQTTDITITPGIGTVAASGNRQVFPSNTSTYTLTATGPGGSDSRTVTVNITAAQAPPPPPPTDRAPRVSISDRMSREVQDILFDYDKYDIREDARATLTRNADALKSILGDFPDSVIVVEGHADERGSDEYNTALGDRRARAARDFLVQLGLAENRMEIISYGRSRPACTEQTEDCFSKNRRVHFASK